MSTRHVSEDVLVLHYYGEGPAQAGAHLAECALCRAAYEELARLLDAVREADAPEPDADYGARVFADLAPQLRGATPRVRPFLLRARPLLALAATLVLVFLAGRYSREPEVVTRPGPMRERVLLLAVGDHLDRSRVVLAELLHAQGSGSLDISAERDWARELVADNRLYRQAALRHGEAGVADVLDELGRALVEIATSADDVVPGAELQAWRERLEAQGLVFKIKVLGTHVRARERRWVRTSAEVL